MKNPFRRIVAEPALIGVSSRGRKMRTVRVDNGLALSVIRFDPARYLADLLPTHDLQNITGVYGVRVDAPRNTLQILFDGTPDTARRFLVLLRGPVAESRAAPHRLPFGAEPLPAPAGAGSRAAPHGGRSQPVLWTDT